MLDKIENNTKRILKQKVTCHHCYECEHGENQSISISNRQRFREHRSNMPYDEYDGHIKRRQLDAFYKRAEQVLAPKNLQTCEKRKKCSKRERLRVPRVQVCRKTPYWLTARLFTRLGPGRYETTNGTKVSVH